MNHGSTSSFQNVWKGIEYVIRCLFLRVEKNAQLVFLGPQENRVIYPREEFNLFISSNKIPLYRTGYK